MGSYSIVKNQPLQIILTDDYSDQGWIVSGNIAYHSGCNSGFVRQEFDLSSDDSWTFKYTIPDVTSGVVRIVVNGQNGVDRSVAGVYEETFSVTGANVSVQFFATGISAVELLQVYPELGFVSGKTLAFNEDANRWVTYLSFVPENMVKFVSSFFTFRDGALWEHNVNELRNNFYGQQYTSKITFYVNLSPKELKNYYSMRQNSNSIWTADTQGDISIAPTEGKPEGQESRLREGAFRRLNGDYFADFLRDMKDPRFLTEEEALRKGANLQGNIMKVTLENKSTQEVRLLSVDVAVSPQEYTY